MPISQEQLDAASKAVVELESVASAAYDRALAPFREQWEPLKARGEALRKEGIDMALLAYKAVMSDVSRAEHDLYRQHREEAHTA
jgi:hypothetical protein